MNRRAKNKRHSANSVMTLRQRCQLLVFIAGVLAFGYFFVSSSKAIEIDGGDETSAALKSESSETVPEEAESLRQDSSKFRHSSEQHARMPCSLCHKREDNSATPRLPGHLPCSGCHVQQFADNQNPMCTICHTSAGSSALKRFPPLRSFNARFNHATHTRQTNCATCHRPARRGVALSIPAGFNAHTSCFQCHSSNASREISSCGTCHQPGSRPRAVSESARAFRVNFSHAEHGRANLNCATCHSVRAGMGRGRQVTAPLASMHFAPVRAQSCASCHNNRRAFGGEDFSDCKRCHQSKNFRF
jgi:c(7)-type cytochrome triheme protein